MDGIFESDRVTSTAVGHVVLCNTAYFKAGGVVVVAVVIYCEDCFYVFL